MDNIIVNERYNVWYNNQNNITPYIASDLNFERFRIEFNASVEQAFNGAPSLNYNIQNGAGLDYSNNMYYTFASDYDVTGYPVCRDTVNNMAYAYAHCRNIIGNAQCGNSVINMDSAYYYCTNLIAPACGPKVENMYDVYRGCSNLTYAIVGNNVTDMTRAYEQCSNLRGNPVCSPNALIFQDAYYGCYKLNGQPVCGDGVIDMNRAYALIAPQPFIYNNNNLGRLTGSPVCGNNVVYMNRAYEFQANLTGNPACGDNVYDMQFAYAYCHNLTGNPVCGNNVYNFLYTYYYCNHITGNPVCGPNVNDMMRAYSDCYCLTGAPVCGDNVTRFVGAYSNCYSLTGDPVCGDNIPSLTNTYESCSNLTGSPVCGNSVTEMRWTYLNCFNLTGNPVCGNLVTDMEGTYSGCGQITGSPVCGDEVISMKYTYESSGVSGEACIGPKVKYAEACYAGCGNITSVQSLDVTDIHLQGCFLGCSNIEGNINLTIDYPYFWGYYDSNISSSTNDEEINLISNGNLNAMFLQYDNVSSKINYFDITATNIRDIQLMFTNCCNASGNFTWLVNNYIQDSNQVQGWGAFASTKDVNIYCARGSCVDNYLHTRGNTYNYGITFLPNFQWLEMENGYYYIDQSGNRRINVFNNMVSPAIQDNIAFNINNNSYFTGYGWCFNTWIRTWLSNNEFRAIDNLICYNDGNLNLYLKKDNNVTCNIYDTIDPNCNYYIN